MRPTARGVVGSHDLVTGSIPACAGEPSDLLTRSGVHPRVCGGASSQHARHRRVHPRVCGGAFGEHGRLERLHGSIPACAGEPGSSSGRLGRGPSPRVRGSQIPLDGSIPACAGEPNMAGLSVCTGPSPRVRGSPVMPTCVPAASSRVHPRVCGGAAHSIRRGHARREGSIPACAGEPTGAGSPWRLEGSIPACAGEPVLYGIG